MSKSIHHRPTRFDNLSDEDIQARWRALRPMSIKVVDNLCPGDAERVSSLSFLAAWPAMDLPLFACLSHYCGRHRHVRVPDLFGPLLLAIATPRCETGTIEDFRKFLVQ